MKSKKLMIACVALTLMSVLFVVVLFPMAVSPCMEINEEGMRRKCVDFMAKILTVTNQVDLVQESSDILRQFDDPWGHKFNVIVADKFSRKRFGRAVGDIIMWSSGPNGVNENGLGDDIVAEGANASRQVVP